jgi:putative ABC transport system permease protein
MAMRQALGASRGRLVRQMLTESLLLTLGGAGVGVAIAQIATRLLVRVAPAGIPRLEDTTVDGGVLAFTGVVALIVGLLFGLAPALLASQDRVHDTLKEGGARVSTNPTRRLVRQTLVAGQVAMAVMLLIAAGLLVRSFAHVTSLDPGFRAPRVLTAFLNLSATRYDSPARRAAFFEEAVRRIQELPGVVAAAVSNAVPLTGVNDQGGLTIEGITTRPGEDGPVGNRPRVSGRYFEALGIRLLEGRVFDERDRHDSSPVAVVSERAARMYWPQGALGKRLATERASGRPVWRTVVGVVQSTRHFGLEASQKPEFYRPHVQAPSPFMQLVVRTAHDPAAMIPAIRKQIAAIDPEQAVFGFQTMEELLTRSGARRRFQTVLVTAFAALALLLAAIGVYAVMSQMVAQRRREIGVRLALGARPVEVVRLVLRNGVGLTLAGASVGLVAAVALSQVMTHLLYGVSPRDLATYIGVTAMLVFVAGLAAYLPSRSAGRVDPLVVLRDE